MDPRPPKPRAEPTDPPTASTGSHTNHETQPRGRASGPEDGRPLLAPPQQPDEIGRLGPYRVLAELGRGGMGVVFRAEDTELKRQIALKVMLPQVAADERSKARFIREARAQAKVEHEHVAVIHQVGEVNGVPFIAMPLLKGQTLAAALKLSPRPPLGEVLRIGREMAEGLAAAHEAGLVHRDIKPGNVWLDGAKRRVRILDFGLARAESKADGEAEPITSSGAIVGTPAYMSPEQAKGEKVDHRSDLFSLGVVLYQMATGVMPFVGNSAFATLVAVTEHHPPAALSMVPDLPPALSDFIQRLLSKAPAARPQTAEAVAAELEAIRDGLSMTPVQVIPLASVAEMNAGPDPWADLDATEALTADYEEGQPAAPRPARKRPPGSRRAILLWGALGALVLLGAGLLAAKFFKAAEPKGVLAVETDDPNWEIVVKQNGEVVRDRTRDREFVLPPGDYTVEPAAPIPGLKIHPPRVSLAKDGRERVRLFIDVPRPPKPKDPPTPVPPTPTPVLTVENRKALEAALAMGGRLNLLVNGADFAVGPEEKLPPGPFAVRDVSFSDVTGLDQSLEKLRALPPVQRGLGLKGTGITDADLEKLASFPGLAGLQSLDLTGAKITDEGLKHLAKFPKVTYLDLTRTGITGAGLAHLRDLKLTTLTLHMCRVDDAGMDHLADMTSLTHLWLMYTPVGDAGIKKLSRLQNLNYLHPGRVTDDAVDTLLGFPKLASVQFMGSGLTDKGLKKLSAHPAITFLALTETQVTEAGLAALKDFPALTSLTLSNLKDRLTDAGLKHLEECANLRALNVKDTKVTGAGAKALAAKLPLCKIFWNEGTIEPKPLFDVTRQCVAALLKAGVGVRVADGGALREVKTANDLKAGDRIGSIDIEAKAGRALLTDPAAVAALRAFPAEAWADKPRTVLFAGTVPAEQIRAAIVAPGLRPVTGWQFFGTRVSDAELVAILRIPTTHPMGLGLVDAGTTDDTLKQLQEPRRVWSLAVKKSQVSSAGLTATRGWPLIEVWLSDNPGIDDAAVEHLAALAALRSLDLKGTKFTKAGVEKLAEKLPLCKITWDGGVIEPKMQAELERKAAEALSPYADLTLKLASGKKATVKAGEKLPDEAFEVTEVAHARGPNLPTDYVTAVFLPAVAELRSLTAVRDWIRGLQLTETDVARLAGSPAAASLTAVEISMPLTTNTVAALKRIPNLAGAYFEASTAGDDDLALLRRDLPRLTRLVLRKLGSSGKVTPKGAALVAEFPLTLLGLQESTVVDRELCHRLAAMPALDNLNLYDSSIGDDALPELAKAAKLVALNLGHTQVTDTPLKYLRALTNLKNLDLQKTKVTKTGVEKLARELPGCKIAWDGVIDTAKKP